MTADHESRRLYAGAFLYGLIAMAVVLLMASLFYLVRNGQAAASTRQLLIECAVPPEEREPAVKDPLPGDCYARSLARQAEFLGDPPAPINNVVILAAACADRAGVDTEAEIRECVLEGLR